MPGTSLQVDTVRCMLVDSQLIGLYGADKIPSMATWITGGTRGDIRVATCTIVDTAQKQASQVRNVEQIDTIATPR